jgi:uncharacterized protein (TIGR02246 family)
MMKRALEVFGIILVVSIGAFGGSGVQAPRSDTEEQAISAVIVAITEAFNRHDAKAWTRLATADAQLVTVCGEAMNGVAEIERGLTTLFQGRNRNASLKILDVRVRFVSPDVAIAHVTNELSGVVNAQGQRLPAQRELSLRISVKNHGVWRITAFHNTTIQP